MGITKTTHDSRSFEDLLRVMTFDFFGSGRHKITYDELFSFRGAVLLDIRSDEEIESLNFTINEEIPVLRIPTDEIPDRLDEIPIDRPIAIFCSAGIRASIVYAYLYTKGYDNIQILIGGLSGLVEHAKPGKIWKRRFKSGNIT